MGTLSRGRLGRPAGALTTSTPCSTRASGLGVARRPQMGSSAFTHRLRLARLALFSTTTSTACSPSLSLGSANTEYKVVLASWAQLGTRAATESGQ